VTSTTDTAGHPEVTEISDLTEGLLPPSRTADVRRHLDDCPLCADVYDSLEEIRGVLGTLPGPPRMPADVVGRIDAALAAEALLNATAPDADDAKDVPASISVSGPVSDEDDGRHVSRETSTAADRPAGHPRAATGPGRTNRPRRGRRGTVVLGAMFTAAALGLGGLLLQSLGNDTSGNDPSTAAPNQSESANTFAEGKLENQVSDLLAKAEKKDGGPRTSNPYGTQSAEDPKTLNTPTVPVPDCITQGIGRDEAVLAAKEGSYKGTDAYLVVLPDASDDSTRVTAYVVDSACVDKPSASAGKVLLQRSYARS
jgi:anti-sigma factor RsiW